MTQVAPKPRIVFRFFEFPLEETPAICGQRGDTCHEAAEHPEPSARKHSVYEIYGAQGQPLYFGYSGLLRYRLHHHRLNSPWWPQAAHLVVTILPCRRQGFAYELGRIREVEPAFNIVGTAAWRAARVKARADA